MISFLGMRLLWRRELRAISPKYERYHGLATHEMAAQKGHVEQRWRIFIGRQVRYACFLGASKPIACQSVGYNPKEVFTCMGI